VDPDWGLSLLLPDLHEPSRQPSRVAVRFRSLNRFRA
jgi:hypothetical protein